MDRLTYLEFYNQRRTLSGEAVEVVDTDGQEYVVQLIDGEWKWMDQQEYLEHMRLDEDLLADWDYWAEGDIDERASA